VGERKGTRGLLNPHCTDPVRGSLPHPLRGPFHPLISPLSPVLKTQLGNVRNLNPKAFLLILLDSFKALTYSWRNILFIIKFLFFITKQTFLRSLESRNPPLCSHFLLPALLPFSLWLETESEVITKLPVVAVKLVGDCQLLPISTQSDGRMMMFGLHHQDLTHHHQPRGPSLKEESLGTQLTPRSWMQPTLIDQSK